MALDPVAYQRQALTRELTLFAASQGFTGPRSIPDKWSFLDWVEELRRRGLKVDRKPFSLDERPALRPIYDAIPRTEAEARDRTLVVMKATQLGLTVWEVLADLYMALKFGPVNIGMFLPDVSTAAFKSEHRFMPIVRSHPDLYNRLIARVELDGTKKKVGEGNVLTRQFGESLLMFLWTSGKVTTESRPMDIISLDEVQEMTLDQIDKVLARMGDSRIRFTLMLSTANQPELDIHHWYLLGSQEVWHSRCGHCGEESDLSDPAGIFPSKSTAWNSGQVKGAPKGEFVWTCPACGGWIPNPQIGRYIARRPENLEKNGIRSFLLPRTISPRITAREMVTGFARAKTGDQRKSFYNRTLARPYIDADQLPVTLGHLQEAARRGMEIGLTWLPAARGTYMGVDQMGGWNAVIIKGRLPDGRQRAVHVEAIFNADPFARCSELMDRYGVKTCVVETLPNFNDAQRFAARHPGRVFLAGYAELKDDALVWGDDFSRSDRRTAAEDRTRYTVTVQQYKAMQRTLYKLRDAECLWPDPMALEQVVPINGEDRRIPIVRDWCWDHYTKTALVVEHDEETRKPRPKVRKVGLDPHFSFATMLCDIAWSRDGGATTMVGGELPAPPPAFNQPGAGRLLNEPGIPDGLKAIIAEAPAGTCGRCAAFRDGNCTARGFRVAATDPGCPFYVGRG